MAFGSPSTGGVSADIQAWAGKKILMQDALNARGNLTAATPVILLETDSEYQSGNSQGTIVKWTMPPNPSIGLRYIISNNDLSAAGNFNLFDALGNAIGSVGPGATALVSFTGSLWKIQVWTTAETTEPAENEARYQTRALIMTLILTNQIPAALLSIMARGQGCQYDPMVFAQRKD